VEKGEGHGRTERKMQRRRRRRRRRNSKRKNDDIARRQEGREGVNGYSEGWLAERGLRSDDVDGLVIGAKRNDEKEGGE